MTAATVDAALWKTAAENVKNYMEKDKAFLEACIEQIDIKIPADPTPLTIQMRETWFGYFRELLEVDVKIIEKLEKYIANPSDVKPYNRVRRGLKRENLALQTAHSLLEFLIEDPDLTNELTKKMLGALVETFTLEKTSNEALLYELPKIPNPP